MEFGWGFIVLFFVIFFGCGRMCGWGRGRGRERGHRHERELGRRDEPRPLSQSTDAGESRLMRLESRLRRMGSGGGLRARHAGRSGQSEAAAREPEPAVLKREPLTPLQDLQRKFVEGRLTLAEYEKELDRLERLE
jgi:hypothetical protein